MRTTLNILTIIYSVILLGFVPTTEPIKIVGQLKPYPKDTLGYIEGLNVFAKVGSQISAKTIVGRNGNFSLTIENPKNKRITIFCYGLGVDTLLIFSTSNIKNINSKLSLYFPMKLKKNLFGRIVCPICNRTDKVFPIIYSISPIVQQKIINGDTTYTNIVNKKYYAETCTNEIARYYCERDKIKF